ncbi:hypothetical protein T01_15537 [Trichinella spiralis]|uniref:Uncharacterized protein n=1 Tax=Trichinella spiralis TaxID=6334 RepID=A0A0V1APW9_TRISP|nr:hypothetical protein T01_15537 [Trichinella spiralis]
MSRDSQSPSKARGRWERKMLDNCSLFLNFVLIPFIAENPISHNQNCVDILCSKLTLNEESSEKSIISPLAFVDMPVRTTSACCEKPDRNMILRSSTTPILEYFTRPTQKLLATYTLRATDLRGRQRLKGRMGIDELRDRI